MWCLFHKKDNTKVGNKTKQRTAKKIPRKSGKNEIYINEKVNVRFPTETRFVFYNQHQKSVYRVSTVRSGQR